MNEEQNAVPDRPNETKKKRVMETKLSRQTERQCKPISHVCLHLQCCVRLCSKGLCSKVLKYKDKPLKERQQRLSF